MSDYLKNEQLTTIRPDWPGNPIRNGRFYNPNGQPLPGLSTVLRWQFSVNPQKAEKKADTWRPTVRTDGAMLAEKGDMIAWLGHATFLIRLNGIAFITDPVFYNPPMVKRKIPLPCDPASITGIDYLLMSHGHMDHCEKKSIQLLAKKNKMTLLAPLRLPNLIQGWVPDMPAQEASWYQQYAMKEDSVKLFLLPALHWYKRTLRDDNTMLWGSFILQTPRLTIYFSGDSGYFSHFKEIGQLFPSIDIAIMGVGAYSPGYMMKISHMSPQEAVQAFSELGAKTFIPMHYGTFDLADEPLGEPVRLLRQMHAKGILSGELAIPDVGQVIRL